MALDSGPLRVVLATQTGAVATGGPDVNKQVGGGNPAFPPGWTLQVGRFGKVQLVFNATNTAGATPTLDVYVQKAMLQKDGTSAWQDVGHFLQVTTGTSQQVVEITLDRATSTVTAHAIQNKAIAAGTFNNGPWGDDWR